MVCRVVALFCACGLWLFPFRSRFVPKTRKKAFTSHESDHDRSDLIMMAMVMVILMVMMIIVMG